MAQESNKLPAYTLPHNIPAMQGALNAYLAAEISFKQLLRRYLDGQEISYPLFGWFYTNRQILKDWVKSH